MTNSATQRREMLTMPQLKERGWTEAMVRDLLGAPDKTVPNPHYRNAAPMRLWATVRVTAIEEGKDFVTRAKSATRRSAASVAAADKRREQLLEAVNAITVAVPELNDDKLGRRAITHRNKFMEFHYSGAIREDFFWANPNDPSGIDGETLQRWKVNYLRHALTSYEHELAAVAGKVGVADAVDLIREKVYDAIAEQYPSLAAECSRQQHERR